jgi:hypothetical protein
MKRAVSDRRLFLVFGTPFALNPVNVVLITKHVSQISVQHRPEFGLSWRCNILFNVPLLKDAIWFVPVTYRRMLERLWPNWQGYGRKLRRYVISFYLALTETTETRSRRATRISSGLEPATFRLRSVVRNTQKRSKGQPTWRFARLEKVGHLYVKWYYSPCAQPPTNN